MPEPSTKTLASGTYMTCSSVHFARQAVARLLVTCVTRRAKEVWAPSPRPSPNPSPSPRPDPSPLSPLSPGGLRHCAAKPQRGGAPDSDARRGWRPETATTQAIPPRLLRTGYMYTRAQSPPSPKAPSAPAVTHIQNALSTSAQLHIHVSCSRYTGRDGPPSWASV